MSLEKLQTTLVEGEVWRCPGGEGVDGAAAARCSAQTLITPINHEEPGARTEESYFVLRNTAHALRRGEDPVRSLGRTWVHPQHRAALSNTHGKWFGWLLNTQHSSSQITMGSL